MQARSNHEAMVSPTQQGIQSMYDWPVASKMAGSLLASSALEPLIECMELIMTHNLQKICSARALLLIGVSGWPSIVSAIGCGLYPKIASMLLMTCLQTYILGDNVTITYPFRFISFVSFISSKCAFCLCSNFS